jgi:hypothetical protein
VFCFAPVCGNLLQAAPVGVKPTSSHNLRGLVCYTSAHYIAIFWNPCTRSWEYCDDTIVKNVRRALRVGCLWVRCRPRRGVVVGGSMKIVRWLVWMVVGVWVGPPWAKCSYVKGGGSGRSVCDGDLFPWYCFAPRLAALRRWPDAASGVA